jgi:hypothetical protein
VLFYYVNLGYAGVQLVEALRYKPKSRGFLPNGAIGIFHYYPGVDSASERNEYQEYFLGDKGGRCVGLTTLPPSCPDCLEIWEFQHPGTPRACQGL